MQTSVLDDVVSSLRSRARQSRQQRLLEQCSGEIRRVAPQAPKIIALSPQLTTGHPVTRNAGGRWVGSRAGLFMASGAKYVGLNSDTARRAYREDIRSFTVDVARQSPDAILVLKASKSWLMGEPSIARTMRDYRFEASAGDTEIWVRRAATP